MIQGFDKNICKAHFYFLKNVAFGKIYYNSTIQIVLNSVLTEVRRASLRKKTGKINDCFISPVITTFGSMMRI